MSVKQFLRMTRTEIRRLTGRAPRVRADLRIERRRLGTEYGGWVIAPSVLSPGAVVYSAGVGADVSFDEALLETCAPAVLRLLDPTPGVLDHERVAKLEAGPCRVSRHAVALGGTDGTIRFWPPAREDHVSYSGVHATGREPIDVPARTLSSLLVALGDDHVDLLKMDIEGAEYEVIDDLLAGSIRPGHLLVEFHHRFAGIGPRRMEESVAALRDAGYRLFAISPTGEEYSFLHESVLHGAIE